MGKIMNYLRGSVLLKVTGRFPERFVNICAENGVEFWDLERMEGETLCVRLHPAGLKTLRSLELPFELEESRSAGAPFFLKKFKKRYALVLALALCAVGVWRLSCHVWSIEVTGNETVSTARILGVMEELGVKIGVNADDVDTYALRNSVLLRIKELSWLSVNVYGSRAEVTVREREPKPDIIAVEEPTNVLAKKAGLIIEMHVLGGAPCAVVGQTVAAGELLVSGELTNRMEQTRYVHALAVIRARTWYTLRAEMPMQYEEKRYTGEEKTKRALLAGRQRINMYFNSGISYDKCDKITKIGSGSVFGLMQLPLRLVSETYREYETVKAELTESEAKRRLQQTLLAQLETACSGGEVVSTMIDYKLSGGVMTATLYAECVEDIAAPARIGG